jgi:hypothetical protein
MNRDTLVYYGNRALAVAAILALVATVFTGMKWLGIDPVLSKDLRSVQRDNLSRTIPLLKQQHRDLRIIRGQLKALPQTNATIKDIEAYNQDISEYKDLLDAAKARQKELK